ncbi:hypothetical protein Mmc1_2286 [Magnetococcus marinus MC-1]|uniref:Uncharacterized protein n=1 Tax=Magnetococcus marinus (strain ATCC BAA-1437 / JCM 17883 / MC-1) TaxID=156889 RepID=A0L9Z4_MAGMM|nr:hypothetical protein [Magnetococcus marinus]ABK44787.1 hypothetical protein Mmc1_2286 [Magnetococcus marinus MC-1]
MSDKDYVAEHSGPEWKKMIFLLGIPLIFLALNFMRIEMPNPADMAAHFQKNQPAFEALVKQLGGDPPFAFLDVEKFESTRDRHGERVAVAAGRYSREVWRHWQQMLQQAGLKALKIRWLEGDRRHILLYSASFRKLKDVGSFGYLYLEDDLAHAKELFAREKIRLFPLQGRWYLFQWDPKGGVDVPSR